MAKKPFNPLEDPPKASSSEDEEVDSSSGEEQEDEEQKSDASSSEEEDEPMDPVKIPSGKKIQTPSAAVTIAVPGKATVTAAAKQVSDSDSGTESQTDSDSETEPDAGAGKAIAVTAEKPKKKEASNLPAAKKRPSEENSTDVNAKRAKKVSGNDENKIGEDTKKPYFQRLWTEEDEISLLQGMIDFKTDTGTSPYQNMNGFYEFAKKSISFEVSKNQFVEKIRGLKKKYLDKGNKSFTKPHDKKCLELAKYIWGSEGMALESVVKSNVKPKKSEKKVKSLEPNGKKVEEEEEEDKEVLLGVKSCDWFENSFLVRSIASFGVDEYYVKERWSMLSMETKKKIEKKWKLLQDKEFELVVQKTEMLKEVVSMIQKQL